MLQVCLKGQETSKRATVKPYQFCWEYCALMAQFLKKSHMRQGKRLRSIERKRKREREGETLAKKKTMKKYQVWKETKTKSQWHKHTLLKTFDNAKDFAKEIEDKKIKEKGESFLFSRVIIE